MRVFLTGATGYIGGAVADALLAAGHEVVGLARSDDAVSKLQARGIHARRGDLREPQSISEAAREAAAVIHTASTNDGSAPQADSDAVEAIIQALEGTNKPFIYTSGIWVYGDTGERMADEQSPLNPTPLVAWRPANERRVMEAAERGVRAVVIRPAIVYGRGAGIPAGLVKSAREKGTARFVGTGENRWPQVHVDDLADLYVRALEHAPAGTVLNATSGPSVRVGEVAEAASLAGGAEGRTESWPIEEARKSLGPYADALALDQQVSSEKAAELLGWKPDSPSMIEDLERGSYALLSAS
jgi:nucleoside-diphosphate-sugar epimerase